MAYYDSDGPATGNVPVEFQPTDTSVNTQIAFDYKSALVKMSDDKRSEYLAQVQSEVDIDKPSSIRSYGQDLMVNVERVSEKVLEMSKSDPEVAAIQLTNDLMMELDDLKSHLNADKGGWLDTLKKLPIIKSIVRKGKEISIEKATPGSNLRKVSESFASLKVDSMAQTVTIGDMAMTCKDFIISAREKILGLMVLREQVKAQLEQAESAEYVNLDELQRLRIADGNLSKKIAGMSTTEHLSQQSLVQLGILNGTYSSVIDRCEESQQLIPVVRNQVAIGVLTDRNKRSVEHIKRFEDYANNVIVENMTELEKSSIEMARMMETPGIKAETLEQTKSKLVNIVRGIKEIQANGENQRNQVLDTIQRLSTELNDAIRN
jgi:uncharacterized protein YaaN involved in tellurite resistance